MTWTGRLLAWCGSLVGGAIAWWITFAERRAAPPKGRWWWEPFAKGVMAASWITAAFTLAPEMRSYLQHGHCYYWERDILLLSVTSDGLIVLAYWCIPIALMLLGRVMMASIARGFVWLFAAFIVACGNTHFGEIVVVWHPVYLRMALLKVECAVISGLTLVELALHLPLFIGQVRELRWAVAKLEAKIDQVAHGA